MGQGPGGSGGNNGTSNPTRFLFSLPDLYDQFMFPPEDPIFSRNERQNMNYVEDVDVHIDAETDDNVVASRVDEEKDRSGDGGCTWHYTPEPFSASIPKKGSSGGGSVKIPIVDKRIGKRTSKVISSYPSRNRNLWRKKRRLKTLLVQLAKELLTQYTFTALLSGDDEGGNADGSSDSSYKYTPPTTQDQFVFTVGGNNSVKRCVEAMRSLKVHPFRNWLQLQKHPTTSSACSNDPLMNEEVLARGTVSSVQPSSSLINIDVPEQNKKSDGVVASSSSTTIISDQNHVPSTFPLAKKTQMDKNNISEVTNHSAESTNLNGPSFDKTLKILSSSEVDHGRKKIAPKPPKKYSEKMQTEASIIQRIQELQKEGMWYDKRLPKVKEPECVKLHRDYLIEEALWMHMDFQQERKWKQMAAKKISKAIPRHFKQKQLAAERALKEDEIRKRRMCSFIAREIQKFWGNVRKVIELREQSKIEDLKKKALDQQLSFIVDQTEKYSGLLAEKFQSGLKRDGDASANISDLESLPHLTPTDSDAEFEPRSGSEDDEETIAKADAEVKTSEINKEVKLLAKESKMELDDFLDELPAGYLETRMREIETDQDAKPGTSSQSRGNVGEQSAADDEEFTLPSDTESDVDDTIDQEEAMEENEGEDHQEEIDELNADAELSLEELKAKYRYRVDEDGNDTTVSMDDQESEPEAEPESELEEDESQDTTDVDSESEEAQTPDTADMVQNENDSGLASLLQTFAPERAANVNEDDALNSVAALAESFQPKGYTLSSTNVVTKIPYLIRHTLREYQHIGLDWLVTMCEKKLNGILADEMGLGKTIQTIALLAHLACEKGNWGPHLIVVPTSVMLNWEMEFKKWCPGFKILTYYGSQKERKLKRTGWTKQNSFHVCITSYKLVIQDHQSFRRKRWKYLILDEAQNIKNFKSQRWQLLLNFNSQRRLLLTGTPLQNNLMELWSLMHFLMPNVFQSHREFRDWFSNPVSGMVEGSSEYNENIIRRLHKVLRPFILRRLKSEVEKQLPKKYEHLVTCRLSKRQRYLYEEFMSRAGTKETLNSGNLLSVINILMQLRKVCNHPNLFEPRPVISPMQSDGVVYYIPSLVWNIIDEFLDAKPSYPVFRITEADLYFSKEEALRIEELSPQSSSVLSIAKSDKSRERASGLENRYPNVHITLTNMSKIKMFNAVEKEPPIKRVKLSLTEALETSPPPPMPRLNSPVPFFISTIDPNSNGLLDDSEFVNYVGQRSHHNAKKGPHLNSSLFNGDLGLLKAKVDNGGKHVSAVTYPSGLVTPNDSFSVAGDLEDNSEEYEAEDESEDEYTDTEVVGTGRKRKYVVIQRKNGIDGIQALGINPVEFELADIQERSINDKRAVLSKLEDINRFRCEISPVFGRSVFETLELFPSRLRDRRQRAAGKWKGKSLTRNGFHIGYGEVERVIRAKLRYSLPALPNHPHLFLENTKTLLEMIPTLEERLEMMKPILSRYVIYIPAVTAPLTTCKVFRPSPSRYSKELLMEKEITEVLSKPCELIHPIVSNMSTQFPDPRLIQYDCGKLQTLDRLLRYLKVGSHRVLIFTQMARMLDILEAFLNYHGHIYLRLDGATRIDQRQLLMERFNTDNRIFVFILSTRSGGVGVNLTGADTVIFYDSDWNPTMDAQAQDRCHRIGQTRDVHIYRLVSENSVEENILKKSNQKRMLGEIAIEGGSFNTAFFTKNTIHDLFTVDKENDPRKRLAELASGTLSYQDTLEVEEGTNIRPTGFTSSTTLTDSSEEKNAVQMLESALLTAEDETDVQAARTVRAEAAAELAEFDESIALEELDNSHTVASVVPKSEIEDIFDQLNSVELYAIRWMENCMEDWTSETYANAEKDMEKQKQEWEEAQQRHLQELEKAETEDEDFEEDEEIDTYLSIDAKNQVWIAQNAKNEIIMPMWCPPTPPTDAADVYIDKVNCYLYKQDAIPESSLPPIYVPPKHPKKQSPASILSKASYDRGSEFPMDISETEEPSSKKSPSKVARRDEPIFAPRSLFDRPSPALAKLRRDYRLQKYSCRPTAPTVVKTVLGPGSVTFPIIPSPSAKPPPAPPADMAEWMVAEDYVLLQTIQNLLELPLSLLVVNLAQTPNWELAAEMVNMTSKSRTYRTAKHCKWRYENIIGPREEGKLLYDSPVLSPTSPTKKSKKAKTFIKITPPSPTKAARYMKTSQLVAQDNNAQLTTFFFQKFDTLQTFIAKRKPAPKPGAAGTLVRTCSHSKHAAIFAEHGINYDSPLPATSIAQTKMDRIILERKKMIQQQQSQSGQAPGSPTPSVSSQSPTISLALASSGQPASPVGSPAASSVSSSPSSDSSPSKLIRTTFPTVSTSSGLLPLVLGTSTGEVLTRSTVANTGTPLAAGQKRQITLTPQQQQQYLLQQKLQQQQSQIQAALSSPVQTHQVVVSQPTASLQVAQGALVSQQMQGQIIRTSQAMQQQPQTQTVMLTPGLAQALGAAVGATVTVSSSGTMTITSTMPSTVTASSLNKNVATISQQQLQRMSSVALQDIASGITQQASPQQTLVSLTPMQTSQQLTTKLIQGSQGLTTFVQAAPRASGVSTLNTSPAQAPTASQQQAKQVKEQAQLQQQLKRIQVVTSGSQSPITTTQTASGLALQGVTVVQTNPVFTQATAASGLTASTLTAAQKVPMMTLASATTPMGSVAAVVNQGSPRQVQLLKQQTIGGKTVTRTVSDAEMAALLKQHGLSQQTRFAISSQSGGQTLTPTSQKTQVAFPMSPTHTLLTSMGLQNIVKIQPPNAAGTQMATLVRSGHGGQHSGGLTFPLQLSQVKTVNKMGTNMPKQQTTTQQLQQLNPLQQHIILQRQKQQQQQQLQQAASAASKMVQMGQVSQQQATNIPTQLIAVQAASKQLQSGVTVPQFQQVFKQVTTSGQVISGGQLIHANVLTKPLQTITTSAGTTQIITGSTPSIISVPGGSYNPQQGVTHARLISVNPSSSLGLKQPGLLGNLARPALPVVSHLSSPIQLLSTNKDESQGQTIRLQGPIPGTLTAVSSSPAPMIVVTSSPSQLVVSQPETSVSSLATQIATPPKQLMQNVNVIPTPPPTPTSAPTPTTKA